MSDAQHITREILRALDRGELALLDLYRLARHLTALCPDCRRAVQTYRKEEARPAISDRVATVVERASRQASRVKDQEARCTEILERLRRLPVDERSSWLAVLEPPALFLERLLDEIRSHLTEDPRSALTWAELAVQALDVVEGALPCQHVLVQAAYANAVRATGDLKTARVILSHTRKAAEALHAMEPQVAAELDCLEGTLETDLREFQQAEMHLMRAARTYRDLGDSTGSARVYIKIANLQTYAGDLPAALEAARNAAEHLSPESSPRLYLYARYTIAHILVDAGEYQRAFDHLEWDRDLYAQHADRHLDLRLAWLDGRIAARSDRPRQAERQFLRARDGFADLGIGFDVALVSLDLALVYHDGGRLEDLKRTAIEAASIFQDLSVHREALAALTMLRDAALHEQLTAATIEQIAEFLRTTALDPRARLILSN